jgi:hypothetical protein
MKNGAANEKSFWRNRSRPCARWRVINFIGKAILFVIGTK